MRQSIYSRTAAYEDVNDGERLARSRRWKLLDSPPRVVLDVDRTEIPVREEQGNRAYNGHFESTCSHPLLLFNEMETVSVTAQAVTHEGVVYVGSCRFRQEL